MNRWYDRVAHDKLADAVSVAGAAMLAIVAVFHPGDSVDVERGESLGWCVGVMGWVAALFWLRFDEHCNSTHRFAGLSLSTVREISVRYLLCEAPEGRVPRKRYRTLFSRSILMDAVALSLAAWIMFAAWWTSGNAWFGGDFRAATNEAWLWIAMAGWFVSVRRLSVRPAVAQGLLLLVFIAVVLLAGHALHQHFVSMPQTLRDYQSNPDRALRALGLDAPEGSATRMIFESRLRDGGPTATFALANSLAGPLVMGLTMLLAILASRFGDGVRSHLRANQMILPVAFGMLLGFAIWLTRSRGAIGSLLIALLGIFSGAVHCHFKKNWTISRGAVFGLALLLVSTSIVGLWMLGRGSEWIDAAPASIAFRLQYWKASLGMALDHPVVGIGPGNFQSVYPAYREITAHETIAEPHNFWFETLAAGGFVGAGLLTIFLGLAISGATWSLKICSEPRSIPEDRRMIWLGLGVGSWLGFAIVIALGLSSGSVPDLDAIFVSVPLAAITFAWWIWTDQGNGSLRWIAAIASSSGLLHLSFSGGWTTPGVVWMLTTLAAVAFAPTDRVVQPSIVGFGPAKERSNATFAERNTTFIGQSMLSLVWIVLALVCSFVSWVPVSQTRQAVQTAADLFARGQKQSAEGTLDAALQNDPYASDAAMWLLQSKVRDDDFAESVARNESIIGNEASRSFAVANLFLHRYQIAGRREDLVASWDWIGRALVRNPAHESMMAQAAEIRRELGASEKVSWPAGTPSITLHQLPDPTEARSLADQAKQLSEAGGVITRTLGLQLILPARVIGKPALNSPVRQSASEVLAVGQAF